MVLLQVGKQVGMVRVSWCDAISGETPFYNFREFSGFDFWGVPKSDFRVYLLSGGDRIRGVPQAFVVSPLKKIYFRGFHVFRGFRRHEAGVRCHSQIR